MSNPVKRIREIGLKRFLKKASFYDEVYTIGIRTICPCPDDALLNPSMPFTPIAQTADIWMADPLLFTVNDKDWLFAELFEKDCHLGRIAVIDPDSKDRKPTVILREPFHMSFPMIFEWNGQYFMVPETSGDKSVRLYQCTEFPYQWETAAVFPVDALIVDSVVINRTDDAVTFLASETNPENELLVRFVTYTIKKKEDGYHLDYAPSKREFTYIERNGGYPVMRNGSLYLVTQNSSTIDYGVSLSRSSFENNTFTVHETLSPQSVQITGITPASVIGVHTYSKGCRYEVIDMRYLKFDPWLNARRIGYKVKHK